MSENNEKTRSYKDNSMTATVGRNLVIASLVLFLQTEGLLKLDKLPFIGASIQGDRDTISSLLLLISVYFCYKFYVYRKSEDNFSRVTELTETLRQSYFNRIGKNIQNKARSAIFANKDSIGRVDLTPLLDLAKRNEWTRYELAYVKFKHCNFSAISDLDAQLQYRDAEEITTNVTFEMSVVYQSKDGFKSSTTSSYLQYGMTYKELLRVIRIMRVISSLQLPDFLEANFPYLIFALSIVYHLLS
ncbi:hypothetical protein P0E20_002379 [Vibrio harveyi]|nr:hypothetical protein [Vibrio harveyi]